MKFSRRQFVRLGPAKILSMGRTDQNQAPPPPIRPPGARRPDPEFVEACAGTDESDRCTACIEACPHDAITALGPDWGAAEGTPSMEPAENPCRWCDPMDCILACEPGALVGAEGGAAPALAGLTLDLERCLTSQGTLCSDCSAFCPRPVRAMTQPGRQPRLDPEACVGCGLCVWHCEAPDVPLVLHPFDPSTGTWPSAPPPAS